VTILNFAGPFIESFKHLLTFITYRVLYQPLIIFSLYSVFIIFIVFEFESHVE